MSFEKFIENLCDEPLFVDSITNLDKNIPKNRSCPTEQSYENLGNILKNFLNEDTFGKSDENESFNDSLGKALIKTNELFHNSEFLESIKKITPTNKNDDSI
jgi:hypothetical protein